MLLRWAKARFLCGWDLHHNITHIEIQPRLIYLSCKIRALISLWPLSIFKFNKTLQHPITSFDLGVWLAFLKFGYRPSTFPPSFEIPTVTLETTFFFCLTPGDWHCSQKQQVSNLSLVDEPDAFMRSFLGDRRLWWWMVAKQCRDTLSPCGCYGGREGNLSVTVSTRGAPSWVSGFAIESWRLPLPSRLLSRAAL